ncbi:hypothetical protein ACTAZI_04215 [Legionella bozemanae]|uniref:hypothetical protein n=1 Tax=Legionella bozemanae TaxID=447 RepID=UPI003EEA2F15
MYTTQINKLYYYEGEPLELDVQAELDDRVFLVECKGTATNSRLILIKDPDNSESLYSSQRSLDGVAIGPFTPGLMGQISASLRSL